LKSVHICRSYRKNKSGTVFYGPRCSNKKLPYKKLNNAVIEPQPFSLAADRYSYIICHKAHYNLNTIKPKHSLFICKVYSFELCGKNNFIVMPCWKLRYSDVTIYTLTTTCTCNITFVFLQFCPKSSIFCSDHIGPCNSVRNRHHKSTQEICCQI